ncbi:MAG TPA: CBS domain-containing protein [Steroidobacteraceae bacterium]|nr:CBS domain-containing protein [Steroidobacteraceae bacterium]
MSAAMSVDLEESAGAMLRLFAEYPIHHLPVVSGRKVVGMLSSADVMKLDAFRPKTGTPSNEYLSRISVADLMSKSVITVRPDQPLIDAAHLMASHGIHALPVVDAQDQLLGIVTTTDIMTATLQPLGSGNALPSAVEGSRPYDAKPAGPAFERALAAAKAAVATGQDPQGIATALLYLQKRLVLLERLVQIADRYLGGDRDRSLQVALRNAVGEAKHAALGGGVDTSH